MLTQNIMQTLNKTKGLADISAGQRPAKGDARRFKAVSLADNGAKRNLEPAMFRKAYSLEFIMRPIRRALPYANIRKAFSLLCQHTLKALIGETVFDVHSSILIHLGKESFHSIHVDGAR